MSTARQLSVVAGVSLAYDLIIGFALLVATDRFAAFFGVPVPEPRLFVAICGLLLVCAGLGYLQPMRAPEDHRAYLWIFGPLLKGLGATVFVWEHVWNGGPQTYLLFAATDGMLALVTLALLLKRQ